MFRGDRYFPFSASIFSVLIFSVPIFSESIFPEPILSFIILSSIPILSPCMSDVALFELHPVIVHAATAIPKLNTRTERIDFMAELLIPNLGSTLHGSRTYLTDTIGLCVVVSYKNFDARRPYQLQQS